MVFLHLIASSKQEKDAYALLAFLAKASGLRLIRVRTNAHGVLQVFVDKEDLALRVTVGELEKFTKEASVLLYAEGEALQDLSLEISSPGLQRPLVCEEDFLANTGRKVRLSGDPEAFAGIAPLGTRNLRAIICGAQDKKLLIQTMAGSESQKTEDEDEDEEQTPETSNVPIAAEKISGDQVNEGQVSIDLQHLQEVLLLPEEDWMDKALHAANLANKREKKEKRRKKAL